MLFATFEGAFLLTIFDLVRVPCFAPWTISFACFLHGHVYLLLVLVFGLLVIIVVVCTYGVGDAHLFGMLG